MGLFKRKRPDTVLLPHTQVRAPHNPRQQLITQQEAAQRTATELLAAAGENVPALFQAMGTIAERFEQFVNNIDVLNRTLGEFKHDVMAPFKEELKFLRYNLGDKANGAITNMQTLVAQLDKQIWAVLRAKGMTDEQIRSFRTENGMNPEAPSGQELEDHVRYVQECEESNRTLTEQNQRLLEEVQALRRRVGGG